MIVTRWNRIYGMIVLFTLPVCVLVEGRKYAVPAIWTAVITGCFIGEAWHRWRMSAPERKDNV